jgi:hypothetical protein
MNTEQGHPRAAVGRGHNPDTVNVFALISSLRYFRVKTPRFAENILFLLCLKGAIGSPHFGGLFQLLTAPTLGLNRAYSNHVAGRIFF